MFNKSNLFLGLALAGVSALSFGLTSVQAAPQSCARLDYSEGQSYMTIQNTIALEIHGFALNKESYAPLSIALGKRGIATEAIDVRGFGSQSSSRLDFDLSSSEIIDRLVSIRKASTNKKIILVGESMGGALALVVAAARPDLVDGVIASEPAFKVTVNPLVYPAVFFNLLIRPDAPIRIPVNFAKRVTRCEPFLSSLKQELQEQRGYSARELWRFRALMKRVPSAVRLLANTPILFLQGDSDRLVSPSGTLKLSLSESKSNHNLVSFPRRGHLLLEEGQADSQVVSVLSSWISANVSNNQQLVQSREIERADLVSFSKDNN